MRLGQLLVMATAIGAAPAMAAEQSIWSTTFETDIFEAVGPFPVVALSFTNGGGSIQSATGFPGMGAQMLRNDTSGTTRFEAIGLGAHTHLRLKFDLAFIDSWDSLNGSPAPDILFVDFAGQSYQWTVNNASGTIFAVWPGTVVSTGTNLGYSSWADTVVRYEFLFPHTASDFSLSIRFGGAGFQGGLDESWGIDNFALSAIFDSGGGGVVPEPATWAMMIAGFGLVGAALRRRREAATA
ncbi:MAG: PEPxxWA-CTERM sorting domain-containing protein [Sphingomonadaceae bacterium]